MSGIVMIDVDGQPGFVRVGAWTVDGELVRVVTLGEFQSHSTHIGAMHGTPEVLARSVLAGPPKG